MKGAGGGSSHKYKRGLWTKEEDKILMEHVELHGKGQWNRVPIKTGLKRCGKSCRLRWVNYLSPNVKRGCFSEEEDDLIIRLHKLLGNRWSLIAGRVPGRTDNQVKNYWNTHLSKRNGNEKRQITNMETVTCSKDSMTTCSVPSLTAPGGNTMSTTTKQTAKKDIISMENNLIGDALVHGTAYAFVEDVRSEKMDDQEMSSHQRLVQFSDEFLQFDLCWDNMSSVFL